MRKLTDEELSRVLSMHAIGKLDHRTFGTLEDEPYIFSGLLGCGCVAGAALNLHHSDRPLSRSDDESRLASDISYAADPGYDADGIYADTPEELLAYLAERGLA